MSEIKKTRFMLEITTYPNGATFSKIWPIGEQKIVQNDFINKQKAKKQLETQKKIEQEQTTKGETIEI